MQGKTQSLGKILVNSLDDLVSLVYPRICLSCGNSLISEEDTVCTNCLFHLPKTNFHRVNDNPVSRIFWGRVQLESATSYLYYNKGGKVQELIHKLKYKGNKEIGVFLGKQFGYDLKESPFFKDINCIVPVPLHPRKEKKRGYNQSLQIVLGLSESMDVEVSNSNLIRKEYSETQTKKARYSRWENVKDIFGIKNPETFQNKHILLVDDVITTGATIEACAWSLKELENVKVSVASLACTIF